MYKKMDTARSILSSSASAVVPPEKFHPNKSRFLFRNGPLDRRVKHARLDQSGARSRAGCTTMLALMLRFVSYAA